MDGKNKTRIIVVGAGLAGLTSAYRLQQLGYQVKVFEARARPGGRVASAYFGKEVEELGGKNIRDGGEASNLRALIQEMGLRTQSYPLDIISGLSLFQNRLYPLATLMRSGPKPTQKLYEHLLANSLKAQNLADLMDPLFQHHPPLRSFMTTLVRGYMGSTPAHLSPLYLDSGFWDLYTKFYEAAYNPALFGRIYMEEIVGGNSRLIQALVKKLEGNIHYSLPLKEIRYEDAITLKFAPHTQITTDFAILALPASTLRTVDLDKNFIPEDQLSAIRMQQYGTNAKILTPISKEFHGGNIFHCLEEFGIWLNHTGTIKTWYYGGSCGLFPPSSLPQIFQQNFSQLQRVLPKMPSTSHPPIPMKSEFMAHYQEPVGVSWAHEEFSKGSYSNLSAEQYAEFSKVTLIKNIPLRTVYRPVKDLLFFAGEHTSLQAPATMEGAVHSGEQASHLLHLTVNQRKI